MSRCQLQTFYAGRVQGVGFRPFVWRVANDLGLAGHVCNDGGGVSIDAQGAPDALFELRTRLGSAPPPRARVDTIECEECEPELRAEGFKVIDSRPTRMATAIGHDTSRVGFIIDSLDAPEHAGARSAARQLLDLLPGAITRTIDASGS